MKYLFRCKYGPENHPDQERARAKTSDGTTNLKHTAAQCNLARGVAIQSASTATPSFSPAGYRTLLAMHCATSHRPFNYVKDKYYQLIVQMLRPGTTIPDPTTVSRDANTLYLKLSTNVRDYLVVCTF
ncbi:hypothetical protein C8R43DRAFT_909255 [Mycena crocata]|nr:hypothetical protein C8R43DRAFT_909255 [Mycena crocata]